MNGIFAAMSFFQARAYLRHFFRAKRRGHGVHSPFVYQLCREVFPAKNIFAHPAEQYRNDLLRNDSVIEVKDFGTGKSGPRKISEIARRSAKPAYEGQILHRLANFFKPRFMLEIGTSLGITSLYQFHPQAEKFISLEGCPQTAALAQKKLAPEKIIVVTGEFSETLPEVLRQFPSLDYVYFDGNHRREPTLNYFEACIPLAHNNSIFIFDDIHWSEEMESAWNTICTDPRVTVTIDLFYFGLVFFRTEQVKENFVIKA